MVARSVYVFLESQLSKILTGFVSISLFSGDWIGRRKCIIGSYTINAFSVFLDSFSTSWQMMAALRFFLGFGMGGL